MCYILCDIEGLSRDTHEFETASLGPFIYRISRVAQGAQSDAIKPLKFEF
jgi:hypothetical protein